MGNGLSTDQGSFTPHGLRDVDGAGAEQKQHDWSNPEDDNMLAGAPDNEEINSLSKLNRRQTLNAQFVSDACDLHTLTHTLQKTAPENGAIDRRRVYDEHLWRK